MRFLHTAVIACVLLVAELSSAEPVSIIQSLGTLPGGTSSAGVSINSFGQVTGSADLANGEVHAFRYDGTPGADGVMYDLGTLNGTRSYGTAINDSGVVAGYSHALDDTTLRAFRYDGTPGVDGVMRDLGTLGGVRSEAYGINNAGQIVGNSFTSERGGVHAFLYDPTAPGTGAMHDLGTFGGTTSDARGINAIGQIAGTAQTPGDAARHAFRYDPGGGGVMRDLSAGANSFGNAINSSGQVVGESTLGGFRYDGTPGIDGAMHVLDTLGGPDSRPVGINDAGYIVGTADRANDFPMAALWRPDRSVVDLDSWLDLVDPQAGSLWTLFTAEGINNKGQVTGLGYYDDGNTRGNRAYLLQMSRAVAVPLPAPFWIGLSGLLTAGIVARRLKVAT